MARLNIDTGTEGNSATGDTLRTAFGKVNDNFIEVYDDWALPVWVDYSQTMKLTVM